MWELPPLVHLETSGVTPGLAHDSWQAVHPDCLDIVGRRTGSLADSGTLTEYLSLTGAYYHIHGSHR